MNKIPCEVIHDILPLFVDELVSEETQVIVKEHIENCECCKQHYLNLTENLEDGDKQVKENSEKEIDFLKKINDYQRNNFILGCVISFLLGFILPLAFIVIKFVCMGDGNIPVYYFDRLKIAWQIGILKMSISGAIVCGMYIIINLLLRKTKK